MRLLIFKILFIVFSSISTGLAQTSLDDQARMYAIIQDQIHTLFYSRGMSDGEIRPMLEEFKSNNILSDEGLADILNKLYPSDKGIGIIFYFFNSDTLHRIFLIPGQVIDKAMISITKKEILQLSKEINLSLNLYQTASNRTPKKRGVILESDSTQIPISLDSIIQKATKLLIPAAFNETYRHLLIIPALNIGTIPFSLLKPYQNNELLIDKCSFTIVPSLIDLISLRTKLLYKNGYKINMNEKFDIELNKKIEKQNIFPEKAIFISNPAYPKNTDFIFPDLPGAQQEVAVAKTLVKNSKVFEQKKATKDSILKYLRKADLAYFATHGLANDENPMEKSFLVLSGSNPFLTAKEIMNFRNTDSLYEGFPALIILSACQTGLGKTLEAGVAGLARSFLLAGSNHVIMSLWNVDDQATAYLMNRFLYHLKQLNPFTPSEPLRLAMLDTRKKFPSPVQWASFSLFGIDF